MEEVYQSDWNAPCQDTCPMPSSTALAHVNFRLSFSLFGGPNLTASQLWKCLKGVKDAKNEKKVPILEFLTVRDNFRKTLCFSSDFWGSIVPAQIFGWKITKIQLQTAPPVGQVMNFNSLGGLGLQTNWFHRKCLEEDLRISASRKEEKNLSNTTNLEA